MRQVRSSQPAGTGRSVSGLHTTPPRWTSQEPIHVAAVSQFAAPMDGEASFGSACGTFPLGPPRIPRKWRQFRTSQPPGTARPRSGLRMTPLLPGVPESGVSFAIRSPQGRRGLLLVCVCHHSTGPPKSPRKWRLFRSSQLPRTAMLHSGLCITPPRWASQEPPNVATVSLFAAPRGGEASF